MTLNLYFTVLFPASYVGRHIGKLDFFFQKGVHLALYRIFFAVLYECSAKIYRRHRIEVFVRAAEGS